MRQNQELERRFESIKTKSAIDPHSAVTLRLRSGQSTPLAMQIEDQIKARASALGFAACGITLAELPIEIGEQLQAYIDKGHHGDMAWMATRLEARKSPNALWPEAKSAIVLAFNYGPDTDPLETLKHKKLGTISVYARGADYHDVMKARLKILAGFVAQATAGQVKIFVDTAPLMEKPLGQQAGLGWQGKHTNLVRRALGSWFFLGVILAEAKLDADPAELDHCGTCRACLDICPTQAFPAPYKLDARRCLSYLTIEHKGPIPLEFRTALGNRIYGCDDCLAVCPWNKFAQQANEAAIFARAELKAPLLTDLVALKDADFRTVFTGSPIKRIGRGRFIRNVLIALGNSGDAAGIAHILPLLDDADNLVRGAAVWALAQLDYDQLRHQKEERLSAETDLGVRIEWLELKGKTQEA